jgi:hypothetical protein
MLVLESFARQLSRSKDNLPRGIIKKTRGRRASPRTAFQPQAGDKMLSKR